MSHYSDLDLESMLSEIESDLAERKESFRGDAPNSVREAVCAFANDLPGRNRPGVVFIGARDDGAPSGLPITDELLRQLADIKTDGNIVPPPTLTVARHTLQGQPMAVITVWPADSPPVRYKGRIYIRIGPGPPPLRRRVPPRGLRRRHPETSSMKIIAFFNNKGGIGKTILVYHLAWMYADLGLSVVAADLDPQANLTAMFLDEGALESLWPEGRSSRTILAPLQPLLEGERGIADPYIEEVGGIGLLAGDLALSGVEDELSQQWTYCLEGKAQAFLVLGSFHQILIRAAQMRAAAGRSG